MKKKQKSSDFETMVLDALHLKRVANNLDSRAVLTPELDHDPTSTL